MFLRKIIDNCGTHLVFTMDVSLFFADKKKLDMEYDEISDDDLDELIENADADEEQELSKPGNIFWFFSYSNFKTLINRADKISTLNVRFRFETTKSV